MAAPIAWVHACAAVLMVGATEGGNLTVAFHGLAFGIWEPRDAACAVATKKGSIVMFGGYGRSSESPLNDVWELQATWRLVAVAADWSPRESACASTVGHHDRIVMVGGQGQSSPLAQVWLSDDEGRSWMDLQAAWAARTGAACTTLPDGTMVVAGGTDGASHTVQTVYRSPDGRKWERASATGYSAAGSPALVAAPTIGLVLVGGSGNGSRWAIWTSSDAGESWQPVREQPPWKALMRPSVVYNGQDSLVLVGGYHGGSVSPSPSRAVWVCNTTAELGLGTAAWSKAATASWQFLPTPMLVRLKKQLYVVGSPSGSTPQMEKSQTWTSDARSLSQWSLLDPVEQSPSLAFSAGVVRNRGMTSARAVTIAGSGYGLLREQVGTMDNAFMIVTDNAVLARWQHAAGTSIGGHHFVAGGHGTAEGRALSDIYATSSSQYSSSRRGFFPGRGRRLLSVSAHWRFADGVLLLGGLADGDPGSEPALAVVARWGTGDPASANMTAVDALCPADPRSSAQAAGCVPLAVASRWGHTATSLHHTDGPNITLVLDGGGSTGFGRVSMGRAWVERGGRWEQVPDPRWSARWGHAATFVTGCGVVVTGGQRVAGDALLQEAWLVADVDDPSRARQLPPPPWAARRGHVLLNPTGTRLLLISGDAARDRGERRGDSPRGEPSPEVNPANDVWTSRDAGKTWEAIEVFHPASHLYARALAAAAIMPSGTLILAGGYDGTQAFADVWAQEFKSPTWQIQFQPTPWAARAGHALVRVGVADLLLFGGSSTAAVFNDVWLSKNAGTDWRLLGNASWAPRAAFAAATVSPFSVVLVGGTGDKVRRSNGSCAWIKPGHVFNEVWRSSDSGKSWRLLGRSPPGMGGRVGASLVHTGGSSLVLVGGGTTDGLLDDGWRSDDGGVEWERVHAPSAAGPGAIYVAFSLAVHIPGQRLPGRVGQILLIGGFSASTPQWDPSLLQRTQLWMSESGSNWTLHSSARTGRRWAAAGGVLPDGTIAVVGGNGQAAALNDIWLGAPNGVDWTVFSYDPLVPSNLNARLLWSIPSRPSEGLKTGPVRPAAFRRPSHRITRVFSRPTHHSPRARSQTPVRYHLAQAASTVFDSSDSIGDVDPSREAAGQLVQRVCVPPWNATLRAGMYLSLNASLFPELSRSAVVVLGGYSRLNRAYTNEIYRGVPHACYWERVPQRGRRWEARRDFGATAVRASFGWVVALYGGVDASGAVCNDLWTSDPLVQDWTRRSASLLPAPVLLPAMWPLHSFHGFGLGGGLEDGVVPTATTFAITGGTSNGAYVANASFSLPSPRFGLQHVVFDDGVVCVTGGYGAEGHAIVRDVMLCSDPDAEDAARGAWRPLSMDAAAWNGSTLGAGLAAAVAPGSREMVVIGGTERAAKRLVRVPFIYSPAAGTALVVGHPAAVKWFGMAPASAATLRCSSGHVAFRDHALPSNRSLSWTPRAVDYLACREGTMRWNVTLKGSGKSMVSGPLLLADRVTVAVPPWQPRHLVEGDYLTLSVSAQYSASVGIFLLPLCSDTLFQHSAVLSHATPVGLVTLKLRNLRDGGRMFTGSYVPCALVGVKLTALNCAAASATIQIGCSADEIRNASTEVKGCGRDMFQCSRCPSGSIPAKNSTSCRRCERGTYACRGRGRCAVCPIGYYGVQRGAASRDTGCQKCSSGTFGIKKGAANETDGCASCPPGTYGGGAAASCTGCPQGTHSGAIGAQSAATCNQCPSNTTTRGNGTRRTGDCVCSRGFRASGPSACERCDQAGLHCPWLNTTLATARTRAGFWRWSSDAPRALICRFPAACTGGLVDVALVGLSRQDVLAGSGADARGHNDSQCAPGHGGPLCEVCLAAYARVHGLGPSDGRPCQECTGEAKARTLLLLTMSLALAAAVTATAVVAVLHHRVLEACCPGRVRETRRRYVSATGAEESLSDARSVDWGLRTQLSFALPRRLVSTRPPSSRRAGRDMGEALLEAGAPPPVRSGPAGPERARGDAEVALDEVFVAAPPCEVDGEAPSLRPPGRWSPVAGRRAGSTSASSESEGEGGAFPARAAGTGGGGPFAEGPAVRSHARRGTLSKLVWRDRRRQEAMAPILQLRQLLALWQVALLVYVESEEYAKVPEGGGAPEHTFLSPLLQHMRWVNLDAWAAAPLGCVLHGYSFYSRLWVVVAAPSAVIAALAVGDAVLRSRLRVKRTGLLRLAVVVLVFCYPAMVFTLMQAFQCEQFGQFWRLRADLSLPCYGQAALVYRFLAGVTLALLLLGLPLALAWLLQRAKRAALQRSPRLWTLPGEWAFLRPLTWGTRIEWAPLEPLVLVRNSVTLAFYVFLNPAPRRGAAGRAGGSAGTDEFSTNAALLCATLWNVLFLAIVLIARPHVEDSLHGAVALACLALQVCFFAAGLRAAGSVAEAEVLLASTLAAATLLLGFAPAKLFARRCCRRRKKRALVAARSEGRRRGRSQAAPWETGDPLPGEAGPPE